ncbi:MAG: type 4a pilus biogenesis protein PilO [Candidatus Levybacteria bacterium]|nr:type 4a pilus biogenesis protein PilO [Candidatus Levybacteria bacterium]
MVKLFHQSIGNLTVPPAFKNKRTQMYTSLVLTLCALSFFGIFVINPSLSTITLLQKKLADSREVEKKLQEKITNLRMLQEQYVAIKNDVPLVLQVLPNSPLVPILVGQLQTVAKQSNVKLTKLQAFQVELSPMLENPDKYIAFNVALDVSGTYGDIATFINTLTNFDRIFSVKSISLTRSATLDEYSLTIRGEAYFKK